MAVTDKAVVEPWWLPRISNGEEAHMASILSKTEAKHGVSASVETRDKKLTFCGIIVICFDSRTGAK